MTEKEKAYQAIGLGWLSWIFLFLSPTENK
jgi:hypothetical protein